jgi:hypothetical protein
MSVACLYMPPGRCRRHTNVGFVSTLKFLRQIRAVRFCYVSAGGSSPGGSSGDWREAHSTSNAGSKSFYPLPAVYRTTADTSFRSTQFQDEKTEPICRGGKTRLC